MGYISREGDSIVSLIGWFQCTVTLNIKNFFFMFLWNFLCYSLCLLLFVLLLGTTTKSLAPSTWQPPFRYYPPSVFSSPGWIVSGLWTFPHKGDGPKDFMQIGLLQFMDILVLKYVLGFFNSFFFFLLKLDQMSFLSPIVSSEKNMGAKKRFISGIHGQICISKSIIKHLQYSITCGKI